MPGAPKKILDRLLQKFVRDPTGFGRPVPVEALDAEYRSGNWDHFFSFDELPRNLVLAGAVQHFFSQPAVLDVGCGSGRLAQAFSVYPFSRYLGVDASADGLTRARGLGLPRVEWAQGDYETWRPEGSFEAIVFNECIGYARDPAATLQAFASHLAPDGRFFISHYRFGNTAAQWRRMERVTAVESSTAIMSPRGQIWDIKILRPRT